MLLQPCEGSIEISLSFRLSFRQSLYMKQLEHLNEPILIKYDIGEFSKNCRVISILFTSRSRSFKDNLFSCEQAF